MSSGPVQGTRVARAATRYRPGKAPVNDNGDYSSDESDDDEDQRKKKDRRKLQNFDQPITDLSAGTAALKNTQRRTAGVIIQDGTNGRAFKASSSKPVIRLDNVKIGSSRVADGKEDEEEEDDSDEYETDTDEDDAGPSVAAKPVFRKPGSAVTSAAQKEESSEYETDSDEEEEESEEDTRPAMLKPIFVPKRQRETLLGTGGMQEKGAQDDVQEGENGDVDAETKKAQALMEERRKQSHLLAAETIKRELAEKDHEDAQPDVSDTDGKDPEEEFQAWRIRELSRLKAEKESAIEKEVERAETERRRAMPESQRLAEDMERAQKSRDEKKKEREGEKGNFMQKYHHKGSFFQDMDILKNRDYSAKTESAVDISLLPKVMQVRDYGKAGRSKWTHLSNEDTSRNQQDHRMKGISGTNEGGGQGSLSGGQQQQQRQQQQCFTCGGPHLRRDCPQGSNRQGGGGVGGGEGGRGANNVPLRDRGFARAADRRSRSPPERRHQYSSSNRRER